MDEVIRSGKAVRFQDSRKGRVFGITFCPVLNPAGKVVRVAVFAEDVTELTRTMKAKELLQKMAHTDDLTGLPLGNRGVAWNTRSSFGWQISTSARVKNSLALVCDSEIPSLKTLMAFVRRFSGHPIQSQNVDSLFAIGVDRVASPYRRILLEALR